MKSILTERLTNIQEALDANILFLFYEDDLNEVFGVLEVVINSIIKVKECIDYENK